jgi:formamidopyrimidine-DNA glycosylase
MPELPEVEVTRRGVTPFIEDRRVTSVVLRHSGLRWPFPVERLQALAGQVIRQTGRRGKYLLLNFDHGTLIIHLGMSGHLRILPADTPPGKHDHVDVVMGKEMLRMTDPRRFGAVLWQDREEGPPEEHWLLKGLGVEPLGEDFSAQLLYRGTRNRKAAIKQVLLAGDIVVGVGNIYASESLFKAAINPHTPACRIGLARYEKLVQAIRETLLAAIEQGGSTLRDFRGADGQAGYFQQTYFVYDRTDQPCRLCGNPVRQVRQGQRSTFYCINCQK